MNALHQDGFCWKKLHDGAILVDPEHAELAERRLSSAPELLEACKIALRRLECVEEEGHGLAIQDHLKDLIAKTEGGDDMKIIEEKYLAGITVTEHPENTNTGEPVQYHQLDNGTCYSVKAPVGVVEELEKARLSGARIRVFYGNQETGRCWMEENDTIGTIGLSTGRIKVPLLIKTARSYGGGAILASAIVKITVKIPGVVMPQIVYEHPKFNMPFIDVVSSHVPGFAAGVDFDHVRVANFIDRAKARRWVAFMRGERNCK